MTLLLEKGLVSCDLIRSIPFSLNINNGNNLMTCGSKLKVDHGIPGEPILYLPGKYHM